MNKYFGVAAVLLVLAVAPVAKADIITSIGNTASGLVSGNTATGATILTTQSGQAAPFNAACGSDAGANGSTNCSTTWTFSNAALGGGQTITGATLTLGIYDIDSKASGLQVGNFSITGGDNLTSSLNTAAEALNGTGSVNSEYDVFTFSLSSFAALAAGNTQVSLSLLAPGLGVIGNSGSNGASLIFSTLNIQTAPVTTSAVPEPSTLSLFLLGIGSIVVVKLWRKPAPVERRNSL